MAVAEQLSVVINAEDKASAKLKAVGVNIDNLRKIADRARRQFEQLRGAVDRAFKATAVVTGALYGSVAASTYFAAKVEKAFMNARTMMNMTEEQARKMQQQMIELSKRTGFSLERLGDALYSLGSAGVDASQAMDILRASAKAAIAGATDINLAFQSAIGVINAYGMSLKDISTIYAMQFEAVKKGLLTYEELARDFGMLVPSARSLGATLREAMAGYVALTTAGIASSEAANAAEGAFQDLMQQVQDFTKVGIKIYDQQGKFVGLIKVVEQLREKMKGMTDQEKTAFLMQLHLSETGQRALLTWVNNYEKLIDVYDGIQGKVDALNEAYKLQTKSVSFLLGKLRSALEALNYSFFMAIRSGVVDIIKKLITWLTTIGDWIRTHSEQFGKAFWAFARLATTALVVLGTLKLIFWFIQGISQGVQLIASIFDMMKNPFAWLTGALVGIAALVGYILYRLWQKNPERFERIVNRIANAIEKIKTWVEGIIDAAVDFIDAQLFYIEKFGFLKWLLGWLQTLGTMIGLAIWKILQAIGEWTVKYPLKFGVDLVVKIAEFIEEGFEWLVEILKTGVVKIGLFFYGLGVHILDWIKEGIKQIKLKFLQDLSNVAEWIRNAYREVSLKFLQLKGTVAEWIWEGMREVLLKLEQAGALDWIPDWIKQGVKEIGLVLIKTEDKLWDWLMKPIHEIKLKLAADLSAISEWCKSLLQKGWTNIKLLVENLDFSQITSAIWDKATGLTITAFLKIKDILSDLANFVKQAGEFVLKAVLAITKVIPETELPTELSAEAKQLFPEIGKGYETKLEWEPLGLTPAAAETTVSAGAKDVERVMKFLTALNNALQRLNPTTVFGSKETAEDMLKRYATLSSLIGLLESMPLFKLLLGMAAFQTGGYTGHGGVSEPAGIVHKGEYVIPAWMVKKYPHIVSLLERIRLRGYQGGGWVGEVINALVGYFTGGGIQKDVQTVVNTIQIIADILKTAAPQITEALQADTEKRDQQAQSQKEQISLLEKLTELIGTHFKGLDKAFLGAIQVGITPYLVAWGAVGNTIISISKQLGVDKIVAKIGSSIGNYVGYIGQTLETGITELKEGITKAAEEWDKAKTRAKMGRMLSYTGTPEWHVYNAQLIIMEALESVGTWIGSSIQTMFGGFMELINNLTGPLTAMLGTLENVKALLDPIGTIVKGIMDVLGPVINQALDPFVKILTIFGRVLGTSLLPLLEPFLGMLQAIANILVWAYNTVFVPIARGFYIIFGMISSGFNWLYNIISDIIRALTFGAIDLGHRTVKTLDQIIKEANEKIGTVEFSSENFAAEVQQTYTANVTRSGPETVNVYQYIQNSNFLDSEEKLKEFIIEAVNEALETGAISLG